MSGKSLIRRYWQGGKFVPARHRNGHKRIVDARTSQQDALVCLLGSMGYDTVCISARTGLTPAQVYYSLHKHGIRRAEYRRGESAVAKMILNQAAVRVQPLVDRMVRLSLGPAKTAA